MSCRRCGGDKLVVVVFAAMTSPWPPAAGDRTPAVVA